jgi:hypothetical protein
MKVLIVAITDYANMGYRYQESLKAVGVDAKAVILNSPNFSCTLEHAERCSAKKVESYAESAKIIQFMHSRDIGLNVKNKRIFIFHGGSLYRRSSHEINNYFNPIVEKSIIQTGDLLGLGAKNEVWVPASVDTNRIKPLYKKRNKKIVVGHFPSSALVKNTKGINSVMNDLSKKFGRRFQYIQSSKKLNWNKNIERMSKCDIYIDACTPILKTKKSPGGNKYGEWGVAAIEAAALGKVVISHMLSHKKYEQEFGKCEIRVGNSLKEIRKHMINLLSMTDDELLQIKKATRMWVEKFHSYEFMGRRLKDVVYNI